MTDPINLEVEQANQSSVCPELTEAGAPASEHVGTGCIADSTKDEDDDWNNPEYRTAEFRMYCFKVLPCTKEHPHRWTNCPFAHGGEHACRRDPRKYEYSAVVCPDLLQMGSCPRGEACNSAHSVFEFWLHPQRYRTQICREGPGCQRRVCFFAHSEDELREVQLPPVEDGVDPFATAKMAKYSMASIPEKSRKLSHSASGSKNQQKQQQASSTSPSKQSSSNSGSPTSSGKGVPAADQFAAAVSAAAGLSNDLSQHCRPSSDSASALRRSSSTSAAQQQQPGAGPLRPVAAGVPARSRGRLSMDAACWMNRPHSLSAAAAPVAQGADMRTRRRYSLESSVQRPAAAATAQGTWNATYACSNTAPLPGCSSGSNYASIGGPTVHMALPPHAGVQSLPPSNLGAMRPRGPAVPATAACGGNSPSQWTFQQALHQQQQYTACLTDVGSSSLSNQTLDYSSASTLGCGSTDLSGASGPLQQYTMEGMYSSIASDQSGSGKQLPQLMILRQDSVHDAAAAAPLPLQLITPDALSLNPGGAHAGSSNAPRPIAQGAYMPMQQLQQQQQHGSLAVWYTGATLPPVQQALNPAAAAAGVAASSPFVATLYQDQPAQPNLTMHSTSVGSNVVLPGYLSGGSAGGGVMGVSPPEFWTAATAATAGSGWDGTNPNLGMSGSGLQAAANGSLTLDDLAVQLQQLQVDGAAPADVDKVLLAYQGAATACRERAAQAQAAADAANERLLACLAALGGNAAPSAAAAALLSSRNQHQQQQQQQMVLAHQRSGSCSLLSMSSIGSGGVAALSSPLDVAAVGSAAVHWSPNGMQQQLLPSEQLIMLIEQGAQVSLQAQQQQSQQLLPGAQMGYVPATCTWL